uniref:Uncharacterized protein n=1 Tax=Oryza punctata TaxID=4537 RepID=A0A0E0MID9_ORYPU
MVNKRGSRKSNLVGVGTTKRRRDAMAEGKGLVSVEEAAAAAQRVARLGEADGVELLSFHLHLPTRNASLIRSTSSTPPPPSPPRASLLLLAYSILRCKRLRLYQLPLVRSGVMFRCYSARSPYPTYFATHRQRQEAAALLQEAYVLLHPYFLRDPHDQDLDKCTIGCLHWCITAL